MSSINISNVISNVELGIYKHLKTSKLYKVVSFGRLVENPTKNYVIYEQLYESQLRYPKDQNSENQDNKNQVVELPYGSTWMRELDDFTNKFSLVSKSEI